MLCVCVCVNTALVRVCVWSNGGGRLCAHTRDRVNVLVDFTCKHERETREEKRQLNSDPLPAEKL